MLDRIVFEPYGRGIKVSVYTDRYAYNPEDNSLVFISLAGTEQAVKALSSAIIGGQTVSIRGADNSEIQLDGHPATHFRVLSTRLPGGAVHQLVADTRFFVSDESGAYLVVIPQHEDVSKVVYSQVLTHLASPLLPEWSAWICKQMKRQDLMRQMEGTLKVIEVSANESSVDEIVSKGVRTGRIRLDNRGGAYAGIN
ncbi:hypothetical protein [Desulfomonile tiedjei]|uniref:Uncharacterized protein n=1 Tax=Desulfomonile tiedjei (strain ATCC 49306 / DSM 6799 / DCB-1) TaxID=706587 RepID=I4C924_DESTA|nr:hypothetical protein [Desulfomonile tiedjei]AFM26065.1 hypothetical protein Desti_3411 [Desulfomonile tiedjei DSM 6799]